MTATWRQTFVLMALMAFVSCGGSEDARPVEVPEDVSATTTATSLPAATPSTAAQAQTLREWRFTVSLKDGSSLGIRVEQGVPGRVSELQGRSTSPVPTRFNSSGFRGTCLGVNVERDLFVPIKLSVRNLTSGFAVPLAVKLGFGSRIPHEHVVSGTEDGLCTIQIDELALAAGQEATARGYAVVQNYFTPTAPSGDPQVLEAVRIQVNAMVPRTTIGTWSREAGPQLEDCTFLKPPPNLCLPLSRG